MFLEVRKNDVRLIGFPRARGDVPHIQKSSDRSERFSPRTRGCSQRGHNAVVCVQVFPAHAGMFPYRSP